MCCVYWQFAYILGSIYRIAYVPNDLMTSIATVKTNLEFWPAVAKGFLCNVLVCLAVLCAINSKSESGKLIMIWWCLLAFIACGFEHSIANMTLFFIANVSFVDMFSNLIPVTIGNILGGIFVSLSVYLSINK